MGLRRWGVVAMLAVGGCADRASTGPGSTAGSGDGGRQATSTSTIVAPPSTAAPTPPTTAPPPAAGDLPVSSSDQQRCAIAAEAGLEVEGCPA